MNRRIWSIWIFRIVIISLIHTLFRHFDQSFSYLFSLDGRGIVFYFFFLAYGLLAWESGLRLWRWVYPHKLKQLSLIQRLTLLSCMYSLYGAVVALVFGRMYALGDWYLFDYQTTWNTVGWIDFDLDVGIFLFYLIVLGFSGVSFSIKQLQEAELLKERMTHAQLQSDFQALKSQIDPHFFFNSLSVLSTLVYKDPELSDDYIGHLAKMYRYNLDHKGKMLVGLQDELKFIKSYLFLISIRHQNQVEYTIELSPESLESCYVPPHALHMLVENAVRHNAFTQSSPLKIEIHEDKDQLIVTNNLSPRKLIRESEKQGLSNIAKRYQLLGSPAPSISQNEHSFQVKLPKIFIQSYEGIDL